MLSAVRNTSNGGLSVGIVSHFNTLSDIINHATSSNAKSKCMRAYYKRYAVINYHKSIMRSCNYNNIIIVCRWCMVLGDYLVYAT